MSSGFKTIGSMLGVGSQNTSMLGSERNILKYLNNYDTQLYDNTLKNLVNNAYMMSQNLPNANNYTFNVNGSDEARKRAEQATYQSYIDKLQPQFSQQTNDLESRLQNQGIMVGSDAYNNAMTNLQNSQNSAYNQAAYNSVLNGQNAYSKSLADSITAGNFNNNARSNYISQILSQLQGSYSGYDNAMNIYGVRHGIDNRISNAEQINSNDQAQAGLNAALTAAQVAAMFSDARLKENVKAVGKLDNGLTVYCFNFVGSNMPQIGLLAQEVAKTKPEAVFENEDGYLSVRYDIACQKEEE
ncbi:MAG: tail fiber domain-containing protein [Alphaproteobacteria bacterium]|nr:tail fiber domain-containing protein [Alphaproteobacteria bacterium]